MRLHGGLALVLAAVVSPAFADDWRPVQAPRPRTPTVSVPTIQPAQLSQPVRPRLEPPAASPRSGAGLSRPTPVRSSGIQQVSLAAPRANGAVVRAQGEEGGMLLHPPTALSDSFQFPAGSPAPGAPAAPAGDVPGGWFGGWFGEGTCLNGPGATICLKGLNVGGGVYILQPHWETNPAYAVVRDGTVVQIRQEDFNYNPDLTPVAWVSYTTNEGIGGRIRAWRLDQSASSFVVNDGNATYNSAAPLGLQNGSTTAGDRLRFDSNLKISVVDLEGLQDINLGPWGLKVSGGIRYAHMSQSYTHVEAPIIPLVDSISSGHQFRGFGPTVALEARRQLGLGGVSGLAVYGSARGALLFGTGKQDAFQMENNNLTTIASTSRDDVIPITELELGAEFSRDLGQCRVYAQAALVGMVWFGDGNAANNELIPVIVDPEVSDNNSNLGLFGGKFVLGVEF